MELEHAIGFNGKTDTCGLHVHPDDSIVYAVGGCVVISGLKDAHEQSFLRGHDDTITCLDVSASGALIASGQTGDNADVVVWAYAPGGGTVEKYRLQEHDLGACAVHFTSDERFLLTAGKDKKMVVWDMHTGCIVARTPPTGPDQLKQAPTCACWGGRHRDIKGRETTSYQLATGGEGSLTMWVLDPHAGTLKPEECQLGNQVRNFTALAFSADALYLFAGSSSSDFTAVHVKHKVLHSTTVCGSNGVKSLVCQATEDGGDRVIVGCGDGLLTVLEGSRNGAQTCRNYTRGPPEQCQLVLDGGVRSLQVQAVDASSGRLRLLAGTERGTLFAAELSAADYRSANAPPARASVLQESHFDRVVAVAYPRDTSELFATASADGTVRVWDINNYAVVCKGVCRGGSITGEPLCLDFTGEVLFSGWEDGRIRAHEAEDGDELWSISDAHRGGVTALVVSNNKKFLVSGGAEGEVRVFEIRTREMVVNLKQHTAAVTSLRLVDSDRYCYSSSRDRTILMWDLRAESRDKYLAQRMGGINSVDTFPEGDILVSVGQEKRLSTWMNAESSPIGSVDIGPPPEGGEQMCVVCCCPPELPQTKANTLIATGGAGDHKVRLWKLGGGNALTPVLVAVGIGHSATVRSLKFSPDGKQLVTAAEDGAALVWNIFVDEVFPEFFAAAPPPA